MRNKSSSTKPAAHALRLDLSSIAQGGIALLVAFTVAYFMTGG